MFHNNLILDFVQAFHFAMAKKVSKDSNTMSPYFLQTVVDIWSGVSQYMELSCGGGDNVASASAVVVLNCHVLSFPFHTSS